MYVLVAGCNPLRLFVYRDGLARFATEPYERPTTDNKRNMFKHLTNYAVNKRHTDFRTAEQEFTDEEDDNHNPLESKVVHKRSISELFQELSTQGFNMTSVWREIRKVCVKTVLAIQPILKHNFNVAHTDDPYNQICFELLGLDILLDSLLKPHLLEVNHAPSLACDAPIDQRVKFDLIRDTLNIMNLSVTERVRLFNLKSDQRKQTYMKGKREHLARGSFRDQCIEERDEIIDAAKGGFERIYPDSEDMMTEAYDILMEQADNNYKNFTGAEVKVIEKTVKDGVSKTNIFNPQLSSFEHIEKIYTKRALLSNMKPTMRSASNATKELGKTATAFQKLNLRGTNIRFGTITNAPVISNTIGNISHTIYGGKFMDFFPRPGQTFEEAIRDTLRAPNHRSTQASRGRKRTVDSRYEHVRISRGDSVDPSKTGAVVKLVRMDKYYMPAQLSVIKNTKQRLEGVYKTKAFEYYK